MPDQLRIGSHLAGMATNAYLNVDTIGRFKSLSASACAYIWEPSLCSKLTIRHQKSTFTMTQIKSFYGPNLNNFSRKPFSHTIPERHRNCNTLWKFSSSILETYHIRFKVTSSRMMAIHEFGSHNIRL